MGKRRTHTLTHDHFRCRSIFCLRLFSEKLKKNGKQFFDILTQRWSGRCLSSKNKKKCLIINRYFKNTVVAAFEQFQKLRPTSSNSDRQLLEGGASGEPEMSSPVPPAQNGTLNNVRSCGSLTSISSHTSATSGSSSEEAKKKEQRRHWVSLYSFLAHFPFRTYKCSSGGANHTRFASHP